MKEKYYIPFEAIPKELKKGEAVRVVSYEFSGIQAFIFDTVNTDSTPEDIRLRSQYVIFATQQLLEKIKALLPKKCNLRILSISSGKLMIAVSKRIKEKVITEISDRIQRIIYAETKGQLQVYYATLLAFVTNKHPLEAKEDALSRLRLLINQNKYLCKNLIGFPLSEYTDKALSLSDFEKKNRQNPSDGAYFAALKLDLDNLGDFFGTVNCLDVRKNTSLALAKVINNAVDTTDGLFPVFVGGDDIFVLIKDCNYPKVLNTLYNKLRLGIHETEELYLYRSLFGISCGMSIIRNDLGKIPMFYYSDLAEKQLENAKATKSKNTISINGKLLSWEQISALSEVTELHMDKILEGLDENRRLIILSSVGELKSRILRLIKSKTIQKGKETELIESI